MLQSTPITFAQLNRLVDWFIPKELAANAESLKQSRIFLISHLFGPFIGNVVPAALYILDPTPGFDVAVLAASITSFWIFPFILRAVGHYNVLALISVQNLIFCILWSCYFYGGVSSPTLPWVLTIPLLAFFYLGSAPSLRLVVLGLLGLNIAGFYGLDHLGFAFDNDMPATSLQGLGIVSTAAASVYVAMMALYYAKILASQAELEGEIKDHLATATQLRRATAEAERAGAAKSEFLARMSHELRTPLNAVIGYSQILLEDAEAEGDGQSITDLEKIHGAGHHLLRLVNEILDLSKIEAGKMELFNEDTDMRALIVETVESHRARAAQGGNLIVVEIQDQIGVVSCDAQKVRQAISFLLDNAAKFTINGLIDVSARRKTLDRDIIEIAVRDTGIGISKEALPRLFDKFSTAEDTTSSKYGGTGLGLALTQKLCELMGGGVAVTSETGVGSCFTIRLPAIPVSTLPEQGKAEPLAATAEPAATFRTAA